MYSFGDKDRAFEAMGNISKVIDSELYIPVAIIEEINEAFALIVIDRIKSNPTMEWDAWAEGALSVINVFKLMTDGLLDRFAEKLVPDAVPDNIEE